MGHLIHGDFTQLFGQHDIVYLWLTWVTCLIIPLKRHVHQLPKIKKVQLFLGQGKIHAKIHTRQENSVRCSVDLCSKCSKHVV